MRLNQPSSTHQALRAYGATYEPRVMKAWRQLNKAKAALIDKDVVAYILASRRLPEAIGKEWEHLETDFIKDSLEPAWYAGMQNGGNTLGTGVLMARAGKLWTPTGQYKPTTKKTSEWTLERTVALLGAWMLTDLNMLSAILFGFTIETTVDMDMLTRRVVDSVGLTDRQVAWVANQYNNVLAALLGEGLSLAEAAARAEVSRSVYSARLLEIRAQMIARTETMAAFNEGQLAAVMEAQEAGWLGSVVKVWSVADDEACEDCQELDGTVVEIDEQFEHRGIVADEYSSGLTPPLHPNCRCTLVYESRE